MRRPTPRNPGETGPGERLFADWGPTRGPILWGDFPPVMNVFGTPDAAEAPIGTAYPRGLAYRRGRPAKTFKLVMGRRELDGQYLCDQREFVRLREAPEVTDREC
jgi:hypothetical protein